MKKLSTYIFIFSFLISGCIPALEDPDLIIEPPKFEHLSVAHFDLHLGQVENSSKAAITNAKSAIYNLNLVKGYFEIVTEGELSVLKEVLSEKTVIESGDSWSKKVSQNGDILEVAVSVVKENGLTSWRIEQSTNGELLKLWMFGSTGETGAIKSWNIETRSEKISSVQFEAESELMNAYFQLTNSNIVTVNYTLAKEMNTMKFRQGANNFELSLNIKSHQGQLTTKTDEKCWDSSLRNIRCY